MKYKGRLMYLGWFNQPWKLVSGGNAIDLWPLVDKFLVSLNGKPAEHKQRHDSYTLGIDENSEFQLEYVPDGYVLLKKVEGFGMSNVHAYMDSSLIWLSGRKITVEVEEGKHINFIADTSEDVYGVYYTGDGNGCQIPDGDERNICKPGTNSCCVFLTMTPAGFECAKFDCPTARTLLNRLAKGTMRADRIGSCEVLGRKDRATTT